MNNDKEELLPCPFCGKTENLTIGETDKQDMWSVNCVGCDIEMVQIVNNRQEIVELWNHRPPSEALVKLEEKEVAGILFKTFHQKQFWKGTEDAKTVFKVYAKAICQKFGQPRALRLPEEKPMTGDDLECNCENSHPKDFHGYCNCDFSHNEGWNACLDEVRRLNDGKTLSVEEIENILFKTGNIAFIVGESMYKKQAQAIFEAMK